MDLVGADGHVSGGTRAIGEGQLDARTPLLGAHAPPGQVQPLAGEPVGECLAPTIATLGSDPAYAIAGVRAGASAKS